MPPVFQKEMASINGGIYEDEDVAMLPAEPAAPTGSRYQVRHGVCVHV